MQQPTTPSRVLFAPAALMAAILVGATALACGDDTPTTPPPPTYNATLTGASEVPVKAVAGTGTASVVKNGTTFTYTITYTGLTGTLSGAHIHGPAAVGVNAGIVVAFTVPAGSPATGTLTGTFTAPTAATVSIDSLEVLLKNGNAYFNLHTAANPGGEIRGQIAKQ
ncbi:MAG: CHRD domain-containing protein [Gemmatimonadaceae bacterium]